MDWKESATGMFGSYYLEWLYQQDDDFLIPWVQRTSAREVLYALIELYEHKEFEKLRIIGNDPVVNELWSKSFRPTSSEHADYLWILGKFFRSFSEEV